VTDRFRDSMRLMRSRDPQKREDGFAALRARAGEYVEDLVAEFRAERVDHGLRCWLLELIGEARSAEALPLLAELVYDGDESFRSWAVWGLDQLGSAEARTVLWRARANGWIE
jgi:HEAT repeat protein